MKPLPPPPVPGDTEAARMDAAVRMLFKASKKEFEKQEEQHKQECERKKRGKNALAPARPVASATSSATDLFFCQVNYFPTEHGSFREFLAHTGIHFGTRIPPRIPKRYAGLRNAHNRKYLEFGEGVALGRTVNLHRKGSGATKTPRPISNFF